jgi:hypothetical protein
MSIRNFILSSKPVLALAISLLLPYSAHATSVSGSIYKATDAVNGAGTTVDYWSFSVTTPVNITIDVLANEGYVSGFGSPKIAYSDLNGDGEITLADTHFRLYQDSISAATELTAADDGSAYTPATANTNGWADGSLNTRDSYLSTALDVGNYIIAFGDYQLTTDEAILGFNKGDTLSGATGLNPFTGANGQDHFDYQIAFAATDFDTGAAVNVDVNRLVYPAVNVAVTAVPLPAAAWLFAPALAGLRLLGRRRNA